MAVAVAATPALGPAVSRAEERQWHALPVAGGTETITAAARLEPGLPAWRVLYEAARRTHGLWGEDAGGTAAEPRSPGPGDAAGKVALPLAPEVWRRLVFGRANMDDAEVAAMIVSDRRASLLYRGLAGLDEATLATLAAAPDELDRIHRQHADAFAAFGGRLRVSQGRVVVPGGDEAAPLWEDLVGPSPETPATFIAKLLSAGGGRRAFLYDSLARLDPVRQRFALGLPAGGRARRGAFRRLVRVFDAEGAWWRHEGGSFARPEVDAARLLREVRLGRDGALAAPAARAFWQAVFEGKTPAAQEGWPGDVPSSPAASAAWLAEMIGTGDAATRRRRFEQLAFGQRVFADAGAEALPAALLALQGLRDARALILALERMGARDSSLYAAGVHAARHAGSFKGEDGARVQAGLQGALALIHRARFARTLDAEAAGRLARSLFAQPLGEKGQRPLAAWVESDLLPALARGVYGAQPPDEVDVTVLRAMAGDVVAGRQALPVFEWEGLSYRADLGGAELRRLEQVRWRQGGAKLADALAACRAPAAKENDPCGATLPATLASLVYAPHLGDPDGPALAGEDASRRHEFGAEPWALPVEVSGPGVPWHVKGSLLGLERALARLSLHRLAGDEMPDAPPVIDAAERRALAVPAGLSNPRDLTDADRDAVAAAIDAGRRRVAGLRAGDPDVDAVEREAGLDPWRARALEWMLEQEPEARGTFFSLGELLALGARDSTRGDGWGVVDELGSGLGVRLAPPRPLDEADGRTPEPALAERFVDLGLRVAVHLSERRLPARLGSAVVATLLPDLFAEARPVAPDDRLGLDAWVRALPRDRLDDAVASLAGRGPLQPAPRPGESK